MKGGRTQRVEGTYHGRRLVFKLTKVQVELTVSSELLGKINTCDDMLEQYDVQGTCHRS